MKRSLIFRRAARLVSNDPTEHYCEFAIQRAEGRTSLWATNPAHRFFRAVMKPADASVLWDRVTHDRLSGSLALLLCAELARDGWRLPRANG